MLQCIAVANEVLASGAGKEALIAKAQSVSGETLTFSNDGHLWVGPLGMHFDDEGRLVSVAEWETIYEQANHEAE